MRMQEGGVGFYPTGNTPWVHIDSGSVRYWPQMSRDALTRLFPDGKTVFIPADGQPMPGYEQARAEIEARGGNIQVARGGIGGLFSWLFGGGGADDAEECGRAGSDDRDRREHRRSARRPQRRRYQAPEPQVEVAEVGPQAVAKAKRDLPTGPAFAGPAEPGRRAAEPQAPDTGPEVVAKAKRNLPTGPAYASAADSAPQPPVKPQTVAELEQPNVASDASPDEPHPAAPKLIAPLPPRRPADLAALAFADAPTPPVRPADLILASKTSETGGASVAPSNQGFGPAAQRGALPPIITAGVDRAPTGALALAEGASLPTTHDDDSELLTRAAALTAPLPPMPIANVAVTASAPEKAAAAADDPVAAPQTQQGWVVRTAALAADDLAQLFGHLPFSGSK